MIRNTTVDLASRTTLGLGGTCACELVLESMDDVSALDNALAGIGLPACALGAGSNILADDGHHDIVLVRANLKEPPSLVSAPGAGSAQVRVWSGTPLPVLLHFCQKNGLSGLEGLAGIPGSVGGSLAMNAGSFGCTLGDCLVSVDLWVDGEVVRLGAEAIELGYRTFWPKGLERGIFFLVLGATLALQRGEPNRIAATMAEHLATKKARQPIRAKSAGCVFKNPPAGPSAGILLDQCGLKGKALGGVCLSPMHANFLVNTGSGTATEALELIALARETVLEQTGVDLQCEVRRLPCRF